MQIQICDRRSSLADRDPETLVSCRHGEQRSWTQCTVSLDQPLADPQLHVHYRSAMHSGATTNMFSALSYREASSLKHSIHRMCISLNNPKK